MASEFARKPRGLDEVKMWKATEYRQFLLYTGYLVLEGVLGPESYSYFLCLSIAFRILLEDNRNIRRNSELCKRPATIFCFQMQGFIWQYIYRIQCSQPSSCLARCR